MRTRLLPYAAGQTYAAGQGHPHALLDHGFGARIGGSPGGAELEQVFFGADLPLERQVPSLGDAESLEDAHRGYVLGTVLADDLADHQLQGKAVFPLPLLGYIPQQAANGEGVAGLLSLAEAEFKFLHAPVGGVIRAAGSDRRFLRRARAGTALSTSDRQPGPKISSKEFRASRPDCPVRKLVSRRDLRKETARRY